MREISSLHLFRVEAKSFAVHTHSALGERRVYLIEIHLSLHSFRQRRFAVMRYTPVFCLFTSQTSLGKDGDTALYNLQRDTEHL